MTAIQVTSSPLARDALCELLNIGSGNALSSLARMLDGERFDLRLPELVHAGAPEVLSELDQEGIIIRLAIGAEDGCLFLTAFDDLSARRLAAHLLGYREAAGDLGAMEESALLEAINIISCSFLGAMGVLLRRTLVPSAPAFTRGRLADLLGPCLARPGAVVLTSRFEQHGDGVGGRILVVTDERGALSMLRAVGVEVLAAC